MSKNEIKLRRERINVGNMHQYRNYNVLLKKLEREKLYRKAFKIFLYTCLISVFIISLIVLIAYFLVRVEKSTPTQQPRVAIEQTQDEKVDKNLLMP
jgi:hypothetical protein